MSHLSNYLFANGLVYCLVSTWPIALGDTNLVCGFLPGFSSLSHLLVLITPLVHGEGGELQSYPLCSS